MFYRAEATPVTPIAGRLFPYAVMAGDDVPFHFHPSDAY